MSSHNLSHNMHRGREKKRREELFREAAEQTRRVFQKITLWIIGLFALYFLWIHLFNF